MATIAYTEERKRMDDKIHEWVHFDGEWLALRDDAPEEIKELYKLYVKRYIDPIRGTMWEG